MVPFFSNSMAEYFLYFRRDEKLLWFSSLACLWLWLFTTWWWIGKLQLLSPNPPDLPPLTSHLTHIPAIYSIKSWFALFPSNLDLHLFHLMQWFIVLFIRFGLIHLHKTCCLSMYNLFTMPTNSNHKNTSLLKYMDASLYKAKSNYILITINSKFKID